nr:hypothetical protein CFP56_78060 [Quercus suber]
MSPNFLAKSVRLRWFKSSPTWSQFPNMGTGMGPGGSLKRLPRSLEMVMATITATNKAKRVFSKRRRSIFVNYKDR